MKQLKINKVYNENSMVDDKKYIVGMLSILFSIVTALIVIPKIANYLGTKADISEVNRIFYPGRVYSVLSEPIERSAFLMSIFVLPVFLLTFISFFNYVFKSITNLSKIRFCYNVLSIIFLGLIAYLTWEGNRGNNFFYFRNGIGIKLGIILFVASVSFLTIPLIRNLRENHVFSIFYKILSFLTNSVCWIAIVFVILLCVFGVSLVADMGTYNWHLNAVFHSVVQVYLGKELLCDFFNRYGLYPHILEPIFRIVGLSVFKFTFLMSLLMGVSLILLYLLFRKLIDNKVIRYCGFLSLIWLSYFFGRVIFMYSWPPGFVDPYFQFHPIRFFFPAASVYFTYYYLRTSSKKIYYLSFVIYCIATLWNFESGFVVYLTWLMTLIYEGLCARDIKKVFLHIVNWTLVLLLTVGMFSLYMFLRYGHLPMYGIFFDVSKAFYVYGYGMLPMPLIHPWNLVAILYLIGMTVSLINLLKGDKSLKTSMLFNLTVLGTGIFVYYQGRSHDFCLLPICYPAIIILVILADELIKKVRDSKNVLDLVALNCVTFFVIYFSLSLVKNYGIIFKTIKERVAISIKGENTPIIRNAEFIKNNTKDGEGVLILSNLSGIYHLESQTTSPIIVEPTDIVMANEMSEIFNYLNSGLCRKVILDTNFKEKDVWDFVQANFKLSLVSPDRNIGVFVK